MSTETVAAPQDARHVPLSTADKLRQDAAEAAQVRALSNHPDVIALRVERYRSQVDMMIWAGIYLGLAFTMVNVQGFAAAGAAVWSLPWLAAWLLDPMVSLVLVAVLRAEQITARYRVQIGVWAHRTKWFAFLATYTMNTWKSWTVLDVAGIVLHSVPPVLVFLAAETAPWLRDKLTEAVLKAAGQEFTGGTGAGVTAPVTPVTYTSDTIESDPEYIEHGNHREPQPTCSYCAPEEAPAPVRRRARRKTTPARKPGRKLLADYVADARTMWEPGIEVTPAWARLATGCSRGLSAKVADALRAEVGTGPADAPTASESEAA